MISVWICDKAEEDRKNLAEALSRYFSNENKAYAVSQYGTCHELMQDLSARDPNPDILFLSIMLPDGNGIEVAKEIRDLAASVKVIFYTSEKKYAVESYEVRAEGYLLKPLDYARFRMTMDRVVEVPEKRISIKVYRRYRYLSVGQILYVESDKHTARFHVVSGETISTVRKLNDIEKEMADGRFLRCNQSFLVNMDYIKSAENGLELLDGSIIPVRVRNRGQIYKKYFNYCMHKDHKT